MTEIQTKFEALKEYLGELDGAAIAFSSGVDSTFLLKAAHDVLGDRAIAITASSSSFPQRELDATKKFCADEGIRQIIFDTDELAIEGFKHNPRNRCYLCKRNLFTTIKKFADAEGLTHILEGSNKDDEGDYRPGLQAISELGIESPLRRVGLWKAEIRELSKELGLPTWDKPSFACLASRFVYGETISEEKLSMVERAEQFLIDRGFRQVRVRVHDRLARIEIEPSEFERLISIRAEVSSILKAIGFQYVTLDLQGYRTGSMNAFPQ